MRRLVLKLSRFLGELKRRHVVRVLGAYAVFAFVILQVGDLLFEAFELGPFALEFLFWILVLGTPLAVVLSWAFDVTEEGVTVTPPRDDATATPAPPPDDGRPSIAVLPFANMSAGEESEYFSQGITEDIIQNLAQLRGLRVVSRTSCMGYQGTDKPLRAIAAELGVGAILEGSVRRSTNRVRIVAQLIDGATDDHLWAETYDRDMEDIFGIQSDVARRITEALEAELSPEEQDRLGGKPTDNLEAYDLFLRGRYLWSKRTESALAQSVEYFEQALELDGEFALAHVGIADSCATLGMYGARPPTTVMPKAREAADRALTHDSARAQALTARGCIRSVYEWDTQGAEADFGEALDLQPEYPTAHHWYAVNFLAPRSRFEEARRILCKARALEPLVPAIDASLGLVNALEGSYNEAIEGYEDILRVEETFQLAHYFLGHTYIACEEHSRAITALERAAELSGHSPETVSLLAHARARSGDFDGARTGLGDLAQLAETRYVSAALFAQIHVALGESEMALTALEKGLDERAPEMIWLGVRPSFKALHDQPRFVKLLAAVGLETPVFGRSVGA